MKIFKCYIAGSIIELILLTLGYSVVIYLVSHYLLDIRLSEISPLSWRIMLLLYFLACYIYIGISNNDIVLYDDRLEIISKIPFFKKHWSFPLAEIKSVQFRHDWTETIWQPIKPVFLAVIVKLLYDCILSFLLPHNYKWIKVIADREYKFYCFGLEMEHYDSQMPTTFDELFYDLANKKVKVSWTDDSEPYYDSMNREAEERLK
ncbi:hypothetical protein [Emticicia sp. C21]|uniref:hypothetical protein n=1 Tax=Emticicia sp. C21 TaxID=2302915 RepID=UPI000E347F99|nr:hypothetical protein [Emticicia sp. C21]RFS17058.1 hypothetical protein D0T08_10305 [Emticicia sp. C21]